MEFLKNFIKITVNLPEILIAYLKDHIGLYKSKNISELITQILDDHLMEYQNDYTIEIHPRSTANKQ